ncbi:unnamed protein product [Toxocara canis]|uniref:Uncharacterized protein n=1 Tax=Toxocara canis TaxID=6265 RepID=A0A183UUP0_TOXCA|nr:unnamed protein product [Toxocara canis]
MRNGSVTGVHIDPWSWLGSCLLKSVSNRGQQMWESPMNAPTKKSDRDVTLAYIATPCRDLAGRKHILL